MNKKFARIQTQIPGPKSLETFNFEQKYMSPGVQTIATLSQIVVERGEGCIIEDIDGNRYIDFFAGVGVASLGYNHPKLTAAMAKQQSEIHVGSFTSRNRASLSQLLSEIAPGNITRAQYYSSGAEAVEAALRLAKSYTGKNEFLGFWHGFHGKTLGVIGLLGDNFKFGMGPLPVGTYLSPFAHCSHCPYKMKKETCDWYCIDFIKNKIKYETTNNVAAIIVEPIQGTAGNIVPPQEFLGKLKELAHEIGALLICDEMITGFGRTGKMFASEHFDVVPDIMTIGKGFGGGFPMTGVMSNEEVIHATPFANPSGSSSSYGGNPMASTAAYVTIKTIMEEGLVENSRKVGEFMMKRLNEMKSRLPIIGEVRGKGLMIGVELLQNPKTGEKLAKKYGQQLFHECMKRGMISMCYNSDVRINPPLVITEEIAEEGLNIFEEGLKNVSSTINL
jgi:4-aminobutyrate aminotransferase-like enzyme